MLSPCENLNEIGVFAICTPSTLFGQSAPLGSVRRTGPTDTPSTMMLMEPVKLATFLGLIYYVCTMSLMSLMSLMGTMFFLRSSKLTDLKPRQVSV